MEAKAFQERLVNSSKQVLLYEDRDLQQRALAVIPVAELKEKAAVALNRTAALESDLELQDQLVIELLAWFKLEFFSWFDKAQCTTCCSGMQFESNVAPWPEDLQFGAFVVEGYKCGLCGTASRFPRYNNPAKLLETRTGRCGEWANCFTLLCRSLGYDTRYVVDWTDHVWTEVFSENQQRWIHCDSCEAAFDKPLIYEAGWGKKLTYVIAFSKDHVQDVTWKYTRNHNETLTRRTLVGEQWLINQTMAMTRQLQSKLSSEKQKTDLTLRLFKELCLMLLPPVATSSELEGRTSGDVTWRRARGELGTTDRLHVWKPTEAEIETGEFSLEYSSAQDVYIRPSDQNQITRGWQNGVFKSSNIFRKVEMDWKMTYLARTDDADRGSATWKFDLSDYPDFSILQVVVSCPGETFDKGVVCWKICTENTCRIVPNGCKEHEIDAVGAKWCTLSVHLTGGTSWQHAQMARQPLSDKSYPLVLRIYFGNLN